MDVPCWRRDKKGRFPQNISMLKGGLDDILQPAFFIC
jgi:hypothetical protein